MMERQDAFDLCESVQVLGATPATLRALLGDLPTQWLNFQEDSEAWSPYTVLVHFVHNERTNWIPRTRVILSENDIREFAPFHQLPERTEPNGRSAADLLTEFAELRAANLVTLRDYNLNTRQLERQGVHPALGKVNLRQLLATWVVHDMNHVHQIAKSLAKRYQFAVGAWRKNLAILEF